MTRSSTVPGKKKKTKKGGAEQTEALVARYLFIERSTSTPSPCPLFPSATIDASESPLEGMTKILPLLERPIVKAWRRAKINVKTCKTIISRLDLEPTERPIGRRIENSFSGTVRYKEPDSIPRATHPSPFSFFFHSFGIL